MFDLKADPEELVNLAETESKRAAFMQRALERFLAENAYQGERLDPVAANAFQMKEAAALGYGAKK